MATEALNESASIHESSYVRSHKASDDPREKASERVAEYLRALGLIDRLRVAALADEIVSGCEARDAGDAATCVAEAQDRVCTFRSQVFGEHEAQVDPLWFRSFIATHPDAFLAEPEAARALVAQFGDPFQGRPPVRERFVEQQLTRVAFPRWAVGLLPAASVTGIASYALVRALSRGGLSMLEVTWAALFASLCFLACAGLTAAVIGFFKGRAKSLPASIESDIAPALPRSALLMPIYHESAEHVFAAVAAMRESLLRTPGGEAFEIFVLSDSREPSSAAEEERAYRRVVASSEGSELIPVFYRRRSKNERQKAGNLAEFFERFGHRYTYAVILDADSLMRGDTLVEMLRRMEASPRVALLQAPLALHRGETLFARAQQFVASVCGPMFTRGLSVWAGEHGNYYGHNAAVRVRAFLECCALPVLSGEPPLGGHILSHDFVEAALLCRAGWEVRIAPDLEGSWEELPPTLPDYVARDRRWCQGNLQHLRIAMSDGLRPMSRVHMLIGAAQYMAGPAWLLFVIVGAVLATQNQGLAEQNVALALTAGTMGILLLPRMLGLIETLRDPALRNQHGGALRLTVGVAIEGLFSLCLAPLLMMHHTRIITSILLGRTISWGSQARRAQGQLSKIVRAEGPTTVIGLGMAATLCLVAPALLLWLSPIWLPCALSIPIALIASTETMGALLKHFGIFRVPSESEPDELLLRADDLRALTMGDACARFRDMVLDPVLNEAHVAKLLRSEQPTLDANQLAKLRAKALRGGPTSLSAEERELLLSDAESMRVLHREAWQAWPVESFQLSRNEPQLPLERLSLQQVV